MYCTNTHFKNGDVTEDKGVYITKGKCIESETKRLLARDDIKCIVVLATHPEQDFIISRETINQSSEK
jgi:hypothetical protein